MAFTSTLKMILYSSPLYTFQGGKACLHHSVRAVSVITAFNLLQVCHWPCNPACFSSSDCSRNLNTLSLCRRKYSHIPPSRNCYSADTKKTSLGVQSVSVQHFTCPKYSLAGDSSCRWPCIPACLLFFGLLSKPLNSCSFFAEMFPHFSYVLFFSHHVPQPSTMRLLLHDRVPLPLRQWFYVLLPPKTCCNIAGMNWSCTIPHHPLSPPTQTARN